MNSYATQHSPYRLFHPEEKLNAGAGRLGAGSGPPLRCPVPRTLWEASRALLHLSTELSQREGGGTEGREGLSQSPQTPSWNPEA